MQALTTRLHGTRRLVFGIFILGAGVGAGIALTGFLLTAFVPHGAAATHDASGSVHACVSRYTGHARVMLPGRPPSCSAGEVLVEWAGTGVTTDIAALVTRMDALETGHAALEAQVPDCLSEVSGDAYFEGCNVQIVNGEGSTETTNGSGNLIVGYNEDFLFDMELRGGSHNVVIGPDHTYSSYGGFVAGRSNDVTGAHASVSGGSANSASGFSASASGGVGHIASGEYASVSGGRYNRAIGFSASVSGGEENEATGLNSSVSGGSYNNATGYNASVSGGHINGATGSNASVSGGMLNDASGDTSSISGGDLGIAAGDLDWVAGTLFEDD